MNSIKDAKRIVFKVGSSTLTHETGLINIRRVEQLVKVLADVKNMGKDIILVTSGAIAVGVGKLGFKKKPDDIPGIQAAAAVGQCELMYLYDKSFSEYNHDVAQILLTRDVIEDEYRKQNVINTFDRLLGMNVIPVVNENDTVAVEELKAVDKFGDNDTLSAIVASLTQADLLVILSDIDGLYTDNPRTNPDAQFINRVDNIDGYIESIASGAGTSRGTGGMATKISAAKIATSNGVAMSIIRGDSPELIYNLLDGESVGTYFSTSK